MGLTGRPTSTRSQHIWQGSEPGAQSPPGDGGGRAWPTSAPEQAALPEAPGILRCFKRKKVQLVPGLQLL